MADLSVRVESAAAHVEPEWTPERDRAVRMRIERGLVQRRRRRAVAVVALVGLTLIAVAFRRVAPFVALERRPVAEHEAPAPELMRLEDGSIATAIRPGTRVEGLEIQPGRVSMRLAAGSARFTVTPDPARTFQVLAGDVTVSVLGTIFSVALEPHGVRVSVERGRVRVSSASGDRTLAVGEETLVSNTPATPQVLEPEALPSAAPEPLESAAPPVPAAVPRASSWRAHALDGDYLGAYSRMIADGPSAVQDDPGDLLLSADVARLGGHPERAISPLARVVTAHAGDSRAPLAAFTLGRTLLDQLGKPREAAAAFATARRLDPGGALAQDALAREVEGWSRAGEATLAHERAEEYFRLYPRGRRASAVRRLGGLD